MAALLQEKQGRREGERMREGEGNVYLGRNEVPIRFGGARARVAGVLVALALLSPPLHLVGGRAALPFSPDK